jgi:hypothetical protein
MKAMTLVISMLAVPALAPAAGNCTFDQDTQRQKLAQVAALIPGGTLEQKGYEAHWRSPATGDTVLRFGGCADLGSSVERLTPATKPRTREEVIRVALELAETFWSNDVLPIKTTARRLIGELKAARFKEEQGEGTMFYHVTDPDSQQLFVAHEFADGFDRVSIHWQGIY